MQRTDDEKSPLLTLAPTPKEKASPEKVLLELWSIIFGYVGDIPRPKKTSLYHYLVFLYRHLSLRPVMLTEIRQELLPVIESKPPLTSREGLTMNIRNLLFDTSLKTFTQNDPTLRATLSFNLYIKDRAGEQEKLQQFYYVYTRLLHAALVPTMQDSKEEKSKPAPTLAASLKAVTTVLAPHRNRSLRAILGDSEISSSGEFQKFLSKMVAGIANDNSLQLNGEHLPPRQLINTLAQQSGQSQMEVARQVMINFSQLSTPPNKDLTDSSLKYFHDLRSSHASCLHYLIRKSLIVMLILAIIIATLVLMATSSKPHDRQLIMFALIPFAFELGFIKAKLSMESHPKSFDVDLYQPRPASRFLDLTLLVSPKVEAKLSHHRNILFHETRALIQMQTENPKNVTQGSRIN